ncbi:MAG: hypothetical protein NC453_20685 [Muribaculum sp.]|nr:hypothetical protein [Muribaculum sp.]
MPKNENNLIFCYAIAKGISDLRWISKTQLHVSAIAVDRQRDQLIIFNPSKNVLDYILQTDSLSHLLYSKEDPPKEYSELFDYVERTISNNLGDRNLEMKRHMVNPWLVGMASYYNNVRATAGLHGIDSQTFQPIKL